MNVDSQNYMNIDCPRPQIDHSELDPESSELPIRVKRRLFAGVTWTQALA